MNPFQKNGGRYFLSAVDCYIDLSPEFVIFLDFVGGKNPKGSMLWCILPTFIYPPKLPIYILVNIIYHKLRFFGKIQYLSGSNYLRKQNINFKM